MDLFLLRERSAQGRPGFHQEQALPQGIHGGVQACQETRGPSD